MLTLFAVLYAVLSLPAEPLSISGSDLLKEVVEQHLETVETAEPVTTDLLGSVLAEERMERVPAPDLVILAVPEGGQTQVLGYRQYPLAYMLAVVAVHRDNPMPDIDLERLRLILSDNSNISKWSDLGLSGVWGARKVTVATIRNSESMALELVQANALNNSPLRSDMLYFDNSRELDELMRNEPFTLGIMPLPPTDKKLRALPVSGGLTGGQGYAFSPTMENVNFGDYPLRLRFILYVNETSRDEAFALARTFYSESMTEMLKNADLMPLPGRERERIILELDNR